MNGSTKNILHAIDESREGGREHFLWADLTDDLKDVRWCRGWRKWIRRREDQRTRDSDPP